MRRTIHSLKVPLILCSKVVMSCVFSMLIQSIQLVHKYTHTHTHWVVINVKIQQVCVEKGDCYFRWSGKASLMRAFETRGLPLHILQGRDY